MKTSDSVVRVADAIASLYAIPISLNTLADDEGLCIIYDDYGKDTFDGMTWYESDLGKFFIHINKERGNNEHSNKGRFTLAHELGHYFLDHHRYALVSGMMQPHIHRFIPFGKNENWLIEREADAFAGNLLMPQTQFQMDVRCQIFSGQLIHSLAEKYKVSFSACALRCLHLNIIPLLLVFAENGKIKWQMHSPDFPFYRMKYGTYKVPENTVMGDFFYKHDDSYCKRDEIVYAGDCFHTFSQEQNKLPFYEYCIGYKQYAFSVFWEG